MSLISQSSDDDDVLKLHLQKNLALSEDVLHEAGTFNHNTKSGPTLLYMLATCLHDPLTRYKDDDDDEDAFWKVLSQKVTRVEYNCVEHDTKTLTCHEFRKQLQTQAYRQTHQRQLSVHAVLWYHAVELLHINVLWYTWDHTQNTPHHSKPSPPPRYYSAYSTDVVVLVTCENTDTTRIYLHKNMSPLRLFHIGNTTVRTRFYQHKDSLDQVFQQVYHHSRKSNKKH